MTASPVTSVRSSSRLARTGGADDQAVRAHAALGRFLEVQLDRPARPGRRRSGCAAAHGRGRRRQVTAGSGSRGSPMPSRPARPERRGHRRSRHHRASQVERGQLPGQRLRRGRVQPVRAAEQSDPPVAVRADDHAQIGRRPGAGSRRCPAPGRRGVRAADVEHGDRRAGRSAASGPLRRRSSAVHDDHDVRVARSGAGGWLNTGRSPRSVPSRSASAANASATSRRRADRVRLFGVPGRAAATSPTPSRGSAPGHAERDAQVGRGSGRWPAGPAWRGPGRAPRRRSR